MIYLIIISGVAFTIGNVIWDKFGLNEPKLFYVPLAVFISAMVYRCLSCIGAGPVRLFMKYLFVLSLGNCVKQIFYSETIKQINDYVFGGIVTAWLLYNLIKNTKWVTKK